MGFRFANVSGRSALVDDSRDYYDLHRISSGAISADPMKALRDPRALRTAQSKLGDAAPDGAMDGADIGPPIPTPRNIFAIGLNYAEHIAETGAETSNAPVLFTKFPSCIVGPNSDVELRTDDADYEIEMVVVIGKAGRDIAVEHAWGHVLGLTAGQDISDRVMQFAATPAHFDLGKSRDTYGPIGPTLVSPDMFENPNELRIHCSINGEMRQDSNTKHLIHSVADLIAYISTALTLAPGDIIFTGTPDGVGFTDGKFLRPGDVISSGVEGIGTLTNRCV